MPRLEPLVVWDVASVKRRVVRRDVVVRLVYGRIARTDVGVLARAVSCYVVVARTELIGSWKLDDAQRSKWVSMISTNAIAEKMNVSRKIEM